MNRLYSEPALTAPERFLDEDKPVAFALHCAEVREAFSLPGSCCGSCHDDWDEGYDSPVECEDSEYHVWGRVCCAVMNDLEKAGIPIHG